MDTLQQVQRTRKLVITSSALIVAAPLLFTRSWWPPAGYVHEALETAGVWAVIICIIGRVWCSLYIGGRKKAEIVRDGPYSISRNPLYVFSIIGAAGIGAAIGSVLLAALFALACYLLFSQIVAKEETYLKERHGATYEAYLAEVPRFFPNFRLWQDAATLNVQPRLVVRTLLDSSLFLLAFPFFELLEWLQGAGYLATPLMLP